jgi:predicted transcriptional regulator
MGIAKWVADKRRCKRIAHREAEMNVLSGWKIDTEQKIVKIYDQDDDIPIIIAHYDYLQPRIAIDKSADAFMVGVCVMLLHQICGPCLPLGYVVPKNKTKLKPVKDLH